MNLDRVAGRLTELADGQVLTDHPLAPFTTYRLGGAAAVLFEPDSTDDLPQIGRAIADCGLDPGEVPMLVLGRGSNLVVSDRGFDGIAIRLGSAFSWVRTAETEGMLEAGGGTPLPQLANWAARRSLAGLEFSVGIPGSLGGGVRMNAGAHGGAIADSLVSARVLSLVDGSLEEREAAALELAYRSSNVGDREAVVTALLQLPQDDPETIKRRMETFRRHRLDTQPGALQNAGSTFKNPPGDAAGRLVEAAGLKGHAVGLARVSDLHANFFIAPDGTTAQDVFDLVQDVRRRVFDRFGIDLQPEVRFVGPFDEVVTSLEVTR